MANTYTSLHCHVVFSTKNREPWIRPEFEERIWAYLGGIARENQMKALKIGGVENHVHLLLGIPPALAISKAVQLIKGGSSVWIKETFPGVGRVWMAGRLRRLHREQEGCWLKWNITSPRSVSITD